MSLGLVVLEEKMFTRTVNSVDLLPHSQGSYHQAHDTSSLLNQSNLYSISKLPVPLKQNGHLPSRPDSQRSTLGSYLRPLHC